MNFGAALRDRRPVLTEGSVFELLRRDTRVSFDPQIAHAGLIYDPVAREILAQVHRTYLQIAADAKLPIVALTDTWRASAARIAASAFAGRAVNEDNVQFLRDLSTAIESDVYVCGLTGPAGDAYRPEEAPDFDQALEYHAPQIGALASCDVDLLMAATLPAFEEACAIAELMARSGKPWMLSFVVRSNGALLDGTMLDAAIRWIDEETSCSGAGFSINCVHPSVLQNVLSSIDDALFDRIVAFQANTSARTPEELDGMEAIETEEPEPFAAAVVAAANEGRIPIAGGCCGTDARHIRAIAARMKEERR